MPTGKSCKLCGGVIDRNGSYCGSCRKYLYKGYNPNDIKNLASIPITTTQKRICASCKVLGLCINTDAMLSGCSDPIKLLNTKIARTKIRALGAV